MDESYHSYDQGLLAHYDRRRRRGYRRHWPDHSTAVDSGPTEQLSRRRHSDGRFADSRFEERDPSQIHRSYGVGHQGTSLSNGAVSRNEMPPPLSREIQLSEVESLDRRQQPSAASYHRRFQNRSNSDVGAVSSDRHRRVPSRDIRGLASMDILDRPLPSLPSPESTTSPSTRSVTVPRWQPDEEISNCPICGTSFTFWYRKHHCRKCGRVVCATCSPHRITIPRQFIVRPLGDSTATPKAIPAGAEIIDLTNDEGSAGDEEERTHEHSSDLVSDAGEEVRLCNPCVPDPNPLPYQTSSPTAFEATMPAHTIRNLSALDRGNTWQTNDARNSPNLSQPPTADGPNFDQNYRNLYRAPHPWPLPHGPGGRNFTGSQSGGSMPRHASTAFGSAPDQSHQRYLENMLHRHRSSFQHHRHHASLGQPAFPRPIPDSHNVQIQAPQLQRPLSEEDECPICHGALPQRTPGGSETAREQHIVSCIETHSSAAKTGGQSQAASSTITTGGAASSISMHDPRSASSMSAPERSISLTQQRRRRTTGMVVYSASEKDCQTEKGTGDAECVICFEEFSVGDEMGRLECLCRFHSKCIRQWWEAKGPGICPVHQESV